MTIAIVDRSQEIDANEVLYSRNPTVLRRTPLSFLVSVALVPVFGLGGVILLIWYLKVKSVRLVITDESVTLRKGIFPKRTNDIHAKDVRDVRIKQNLLERIMGVGSISVSSAANVDHAEISLDGIPNLRAVRETLHFIRHR